MAPRALDVRINGKNDTGSAFAEVTRSAEALEAKISALNKPFEALQSVISSFAGLVVVEFFRKTVEAAAEAEQAWARVGSAVSNAGIRFDGVQDRLEKLFATMSKTSRFSERDLSDAFGTLLNVTNDYKASVDNLDLVTNIAVARHMDLNQAATLVGRVIDGNTSMLKRYGIVLRDDGIAPMDQLRERFKGFAEKDAETLGGALARLANAWEKIQEAIGRSIAGEGGGKGLDGVIDRMGRLANFIDAHSATWDRIERLFNAMGAVQTRGIEQLSPFARMMNHFTGDDGTAREVDYGAAMMAGGQRMLADREVAANAATAKAERDAEEAKRELERIRKEIADMEGGIGVNPDVARSIEQWKKAGFDPTANLGVTNALHAGDLRARLNDASMAFLNAGGPQAADLTSTPFNSNRPAQTMAEATRTVTGFGRGLRESFGDGSQYLADFDERLGKMAGESIPALAAGFEKMFEAIGSGANVFKTVGRGVAEMIGQVAAKMSAEEFAQGLAMLARSIWDFLGPNPAAGASATQHFAAAAAFGALAGASNLAAGGAGGGRGGALGGSSFQSQQSAINSGNRKATVVFKGGAFLNLADPEQRAEFIANLRELAGDADLDFLFE